MGKDNAYRKKKKLKKKGKKEKKKKFPLNSHRCCNIFFKCLTVFVIKLPRQITGAPLGTHVVDGSAVGIKET